MAQAGKVLPRILANRLNEFCQEALILPEEQCGFRLQRSTTDVMFVVRKLQELGGRTNTSLETCFIIDLTNAHDSVDRVPLWEVVVVVVCCYPTLTDPLPIQPWSQDSVRFGVPPRTIKVIRIFHDGMWARVQLDGGDFSAWFNVCQGLRQGCVLSPLLLNTLFAVVLIVVLPGFAAECLGLGVPR